MVLSRSLILQDGVAVGPQARVCYGSGGAICAGFTSGEVTLKSCCKCFSFIKSVINSSSARIAVRTESSYGGRPSATSHKYLCTWS